jgi:hypothetical protein
MYGCVLVHPELFLITLLLEHIVSGSMWGIATIGATAEVTHNLGSWVAWKQDIISSLIVWLLFT